MTHELPADVYDQITSLSRDGDALAEAELFDQAIEKYNEAWELVPEPKNQWNASTWILVAIGDACFFARYFTSGIEACAYALTCPDALENPFIYLRLGQCQFEKADLGAAADNLTRAYMLGGKEVFDLEDVKFFDFLKTKISPPAKGTW
jgi:tetratricopeptide (TPR) repeat protein